LGFRGPPEERMQTPDSKDLMCPTLAMRSWTSYCTSLSLFRKVSWQLPVCSQES
jgi:hypothetical protein